VFDFSPPNNSVFPLWLQKRVFRPYGKRSFVRSSCFSILRRERYIPFFVSVQRMYQQNVEKHYRAHGVFKSVTRPLEHARDTTIKISSAGRRPFLRPVTIVETISFRPTFPNLSESIRAVRSTNKRRHFGSEEGGGREEQINTYANRPR